LKDIPISTMADQKSKDEEFDLSRFSKDYKGKIVMRLTREEGLQRKFYTDKQKEKLKNIAAAEGFKVGDEDGKAKKIRDIKLKLFAITAENFDEICDDLTVICEDGDLVKDLISLLVERARMHSTFTELYAVLCTRLAAGKYTWMKDGEDGQKQFKVHVASVLRSEFFSGFENFKKWIKEASAKTDFDANDYLIAYVKRKMKLLGNISFIAHLYNKGFLTLKVIKLVTFIMIQNVCENLYERNLEKNQEEQVYLEALIKLFDSSGKTIEEQEDKKIKKNKVYDGRVSDFLGHVDGLIKTPPTGPWKEESFYGDYPETERNLWHVGKVGMKFLEQCLEYNIRPELSS
jgi:hypothetical protein